MEAMAAEKAGIFKPGIPAVLAPQRPEAESTLRERAAATGSPLIDAWEWRLEACTLDRHGNAFDLRRAGDCSVHVRCPLPGGHPIANPPTPAATDRTLP